VASLTYQDAFVGDYETSRDVDRKVSISTAAGVVTVKNGSYHGTTDFASFVTKGADGATTVTIKFDPKEAKKEDGTTYMQELKMVGAAEFDDDIMDGKLCTTIVWTNGSVWGKLGLPAAAADDGPVNAEYEKAPPLTANENSLMKTCKMGDLAEFEKLVKAGTNFKSIRDKVRACVRAYRANLS
jgi:hypothetical protein